MHRVVSCGIKHTCFERLGNPHVQSINVSIGVPHKYWLWMLLRGSVGVYAKIR